MKLFFKHAKRRDCINNSIKAALLVGTILALINHYDGIFMGTLDATEIFQILLTYLVPYSVATYGFAINARSSELKELEKIKAMTKEELKVLHNIEDKIES